LPDFTTFCKGNIFPRHISRETFERLKDVKYFTPLFDYKLHIHNPVHKFTSDGTYSEINNNWYMHDGKPYKYFSSYNDFIQAFFKDPHLPEYITFCPGANYVVPKGNILKYPVDFYFYLRKMLLHNSHAAESHLLERALQTIWTCNFELSDTFTKLIA
jgi:hypothetical protein